MDKSLTGLKIEYWYHVLVVLGAAGVIAAMTFELKGIANAHAIIMSLGVLFVGLGEWINHPLQTKIMPPNVYMGGGGIISGHPRNPNFLGTLFDILGFILICISIYKISNAP
ncbi:MAG: hypothetical protein HYS19_05430 [Nitrosomonadales bacterium]|nr:hypothetical protein [Nitrosomonadales bacterium]